MELQAMEVDHNANVNLTKDETMDQIKAFWLKNDIQVHGRDPPLPILDMNNYDWPEPIRQALQTDNFSEPTAIQSQGWPIVLSGRDMVGVAQTGSGKTLCYVLPAFVKIMKEGIKRGPKCLILAPTRELAQQIQSVIRRYNFATNVCLYGGASRLPQMQILRENNPQIIIATPGRMNDMIESGAVDVSTVDYLVLDEADRMLDMGFEPQIKRIIDQIPSERQTVMWSATWPKDVKMLAANYMRDYIQINVGGIELTANKNIEQVIEVCEEFDKKRKLFEVLNRIRADSSENKTLIFVRTKQSVDFLTSEIRRKGWSAVGIHGDKTQSVRDRVLADFRKSRFSILVATDVAARGLGNSSCLLRLVWLQFITDVDDIKYVINFDFPNTTEDYVHRIGRTGRLDKKGTSFTFMSSQDSRMANDLIEVLRDSSQIISPELMQLAEMSRNSSDRGKPKYRYGGSSSYGGGNQSYRNSGYGRNSSYNRPSAYGSGQRRAPYGSTSYGPDSRASYDSYESRSYGNNRSNYRSTYRPNQESGRDYVPRDGEHYRGYWLIHC